MAITEEQIKQNQLLLRKGMHVLNEHAELIERAKNNEIVNEELDRISFKTKQFLQALENIDT